MNLDELKKQIEESNFSPEARLVIFDVLEKSNVGGEIKISPENRERLLGVVDLELEKNKLEIEIREGVASALEEFADSIESTVKEANQTTTNKEQKTS